MRSRFIATLLFSLGLSASGHSQQIRITVLEAHHGKPMPDQCVSISLGSRAYLALTNKDGTVILSFDGKQATVEPVPGKTCVGLTSPWPVLIAELPTRIDVDTLYEESCQHSRKLMKDPAWLQRIPGFAIQDILSRGIAATNGCSKLRPTPKPGELVIVARKEGISS